MMRKHSALADLYKGPGGRERLSKVLEKKFQQRVKSTPDVDVRSDRVRDLLKKTRNFQGSSVDSAVAAGLHLGILPASTVMPPLITRPSVHVLPKESLALKMLSVSRNPKIRNVSKLSRSRQGQAITGHHELDEVISKGRGGKGMIYTPQTLGARKAVEIQANPQYKNLIEAVKAKDIRRSLVSAFKSRKAIAADLKHMKELQKVVPAAHRGADVILNESNRVFHEASPDITARFKKLRAGNESLLLKRHGLRYGDEYVQPGTRRYNKLVKNIEDSVGSGLLPHKSGKLVKFY
jgi:hypothetical protein